MVKQPHPKIVPAPSPSDSHLQYFSLALLLALVVFGCAGQVSPSGGPPDTVPPRIVSTSPGQGSLHVRNSPVVLEFSEYVDKRSVENSIFISPDIGDLTFDWGTTDVAITYSGELRDSTTYVLTVGTDVTDIRNKNRMASSFSLAFSTGDRIDTAGISGRIFDPNPSGIMIFAYGHEGRMIDTLHPSRMKPDHITQTGKDGSFELPFLAYGRYRLIAVRDEYKNLLYDAEVDQFGLPSSEFMLTPEHRLVQGVQIRMTVEDTTRPFLSSIRSLDSRHALLRFSEEIDTSSFGPDDITIVDTSTSRTLGIADYSYVIGRPGEVLLLTEPQESLAAYRASLRNVRDLAGNSIGATPEQNVMIGLGADTSAPGFIVKTTTDTLISPFPGDTILFRFSEPVQRNLFEQGVSLFDSGGVAFPLRFRWWNGGAVSLVPETGLDFQTEYRLRIALDSIRDAAGLSAGDTVTFITFWTIDHSTLGVLKGRIGDADSLATGELYVFARPISTRNGAKRVVTLPHPDEFSFTGLPEGKYVVEGFRDADGDGRYSYGKLEPYTLSERFAVHPETLKIRARWPVEGANLFLR